MMENYTAEKTVIDEGKVQELERLLLLFSPTELKDFYTEHSAQMLLTTSAQIERHQAIKELLEILSKN
jgi:hypothetical protein